MVYDSFFMGIEFECPQRDMDFFYFFIFCPYIFFSPFLRYCHVGFSSIKKGLFGKYYRDCPMSKTGILSSHFCVHFFHFFWKIKDLI